MALLLKLRFLGMPGAVVCSIRPLIPVNAPGDGRLCGSSKEFSRECDVEVSVFIPCLQKPNQSLPYLRESVADGPKKWRRVHPAVIWTQDTMLRRKQFDLVPVQQMQRTGKTP
ncbi:hypothetical protein [uncultured Roseibium sp.]|uniref:hypothetical protein n=1 Tax=uncultured Roseibium sp. TaxID=1936171 RepID=UPI002639FC39|nr:hypothetical protein [uncultured Roseibium sp.]